MLRTITALSLLFFPTLAFAQNKKAMDTATVKMAPVTAIVTDMKGKPSKGELVLFKSDATQKIFQARSDANGRFGIQLPAGDKYVISLKNLTDSSKYGMINIPALGPDESFEEPFKVNIKFQPARHYTLDNVHFDVGKATLRPESYKQLEELVEYMKYKDEEKIEIAGHTDNVGKEADNIKLSQQRAETIRAYLIKKGIQPARVIAHGYGASQPIADNNTEEGKQLNRRTEVRVL